MIGSRLIIALKPICDLSDKGLLYMAMKKLGSLNGKDFDLEFVKQMIPHHEGAVQMAKEALQRSGREEIKILANAIIKSQETEIKQMKNWQADWSK